ncbi:MAG: hypothetical protein J6Y92_11885 [Lentisphaeria bacterium]|nr:hypothetical protein [Lentisphaeria bacterium]
MKLNPPTTEYFVSDLYAAIVNLHETAGKDTVADCFSSGVHEHFVFTTYCGDAEDAATGYEVVRHGSDSFRVYVFELMLCRFEFRFREKGCFFWMRT